MKDWWKRLKAWQKAGIAIGVIYTAVYTILYSLLIYYAPHGESGVGYLLMFLTWPWIGILIKFGVGPGTFGSLLLIGLFSALMNSFFAMVLVRLATSTRRASRGTKG